MTLSLPARPAGARSLTEVLPILIDALEGTSAVLPPVRSGIVFVLDGLGARNLAARRAHGRFLAAAMGRKDVARSVFPSTTAAALTSLLTAAWPGEHGVVGYRVRLPETGVVVNQLNGWEGGGLDPLTWQRAEPLLMQEARRGRPCFVVSKPDYVTSGFTAATLRGAEIHGAGALDERVELAAHLARSHEGALVYLYGPELDVVGHRKGADSDEWAFALEAVDAAARRLHEAVGATAGILVTADHGMVDVAPSRHVLFGEGPLTDGVTAVGGEPRMLHLYAAEGAASDLHAAWSASERDRAWVLTRDEAIGAGLFGPHVDEAVAARIGDVLVVARARLAYYDDRVADTSPRKMVGQHGSLSDEETTVPLIRLGAFSR
ncbi:MAG: alkaline phosphatase family protein [Microbacterium sp.]|uniref:alkaline phosphatase family protein n=1 Tax=Microbacterium sp. TaxID=51671 RepID=UPI0039E6C370